MDTDAADVKQESLSGIINVWNAQRMRIYGVKNVLKEAKNAVKRGIISSLKQGHSASGLKR